MMMASNEDEDCCIISCRLSSAPSFVCLSLRILSLPHTFRGNQRETCYVRTVTKLHLVYFTRQKTSPALTFMSSRSIVSFILRPNTEFFLIICSAWYARCLAVWQLQVSGGMICPAYRCPAEPSCTFAKSLILLLLESRRYWRLVPLLHPTSCTLSRAEE